MPKAYKKTLVDKMPDWVTKMKEQGHTDEEIKQFLAQKTEKHINKHSNKSRIGLILDMSN